jgi:hypothetical protein
LVLILKIIILWSRQGIIFYKKIEAILTMPVLINLRTAVILENRVPSFLTLPISLMISMVWIMGI